MGIFEFSRLQFLSENGYSFRDKYLHWSQAYFIFVSIVTDVCRTAPLG
jgi:hypothetical protein